MKYVSVVFLYVTLLGCNVSNKIDLRSTTWEESGWNASFLVKPGIPAYGGTVVTYKQTGKSILTVWLEEPTIVGVAMKPEKWGFFQFPSFYRSQDDSTFVAKWNLSEDAVESYGKGENGSAISRDGGKTWTPNNGEHSVGEGLLLPNGDRIQIYTPLL